MARDEAVSGRGQADDQEPFDPLVALRALVAHQVKFVVIGGFAAAIRGSPVITGDLDVCYARDDDNMRALAEALRDLKATLRDAPRGIPFQLEALRLREGDQFAFSTLAGPLDILATPRGTSGFGDLDQDATDEDLDGFTVRVCSLEDLMRMMRAAGSTKDRIALEWLGALRDEIERGGA